MFRTLILLGRYSKMMDLGGKPLSEGNRKLAKSLTRSLSRKLAVRGILFDYNVITNVAPESAVAEPEEGEVEKEETVSFRLPAHVADMAAVLGVNVSATGDGVSLGKVEDDDKDGKAPPLTREEEEEEVAALDLSRPRGLKKDMMKNGPSDVVPGADDIRAKYMAKLKAKRGIDASQILGTPGKVGSTASSEQDSTFHLSLRSSIVSSEKDSEPNKYASGRWLPVSGMGKLLQYVCSRSIKVGIMSGWPLLPSYKAGDVMEYQRQLGMVDFDFVFDEGAAQDDEALVPASIQELDVESGSAGDLSGVMVVSQETRILKAARDANSYTCYVVPKSGRRCGISTNYTINSIGELRDVIDDVNGVSFNNVRRVDYGIDHGGV